MKKLIINRSSKTKDWYKEEADRIRSLEEDVYDSMGNSFNKKDEIKKNYNIYKNRINPEDYESILRPFGENINVEIIEEIENEDIASSKIKAVVGMEMKRPFPYKVIAINSEATSRKEEAYYQKVREFVVNSVMKPIREKVMMQQKQQMEGKELTPEQQQEIEGQLQKQIDDATPQRVKQYMEREHQDIAEVVGNHILNYLKNKENLMFKFSRCFLYGLLAGYEVAYIGERNGHPCLDVISPEDIYFSHVKTGMIEDAEKIVCRYYWTPSEILTYFNKELSKDEITRIYESNVESFEDDFDFSKDSLNEYARNICVEHCLWKGVRKIKEVVSRDENGDFDISIEDESYVLNTEAGDISATEMFIPELYETWVINLAEPIHLRMRPYPGQSFDPEDVYNKKMPYKGVLYDSLGGDSVALMSRLSGPQVFYNIVKTTLKRLIKSDKGKKLLLNIGVVPTSQGIDTEKFMHYFENSPFALINPNEEGNGYNDINTSAKVIDMSLISDIQKYIMILRTIKTEAGKSVGITEQVEGQISANEAVSNTQQSLIQSSQILEPYFHLHNEFKRQCLEGLLERAKVIYRNDTEKKLSYVTDDVSMQMFKFDGEFMSFQKLGVFVTDNIKISEVRQTLQQLALAAMQNQKAELSDIISVFKVESLAEAEEILKVAEDRRRVQEQEMQSQAQKGEMDKMAKAEEFTQKDHERKKEIITHSEEERRKTEIVRGTITAASYNPDADLDKDGVNDFVEMATKVAKVNIEEEMMQVQKGKLELEKEKMKQENNKVNNNQNNN